MDVEVFLGTIQTIFAILGVGIAAIQLLQQWPRPHVMVSLLQTFTL
jgi:hypothetical protein